MRQRDEWAEDKDNATTCYGPIASANQLMKDTLIRDKLAEVAAMDWIGLDLILTSSMSL